MFCRVFVATDEPQFLKGTGCGESLTDALVGQRCDQNHWGLVAYACCINRRIVGGVLDGCMGALAAIPAAAVLG
jgi:hypothetical protein